MMSTRTARSSRRPATAANVRVSATLGSFFGDRVTVTLSLINGPRQVDVSATVSCDLRGGDARIVGGQDYRSRDLEADPRSLERMLALVADRLPAAARAAVLWRAQPPRLPKGVGIAPWRAPRGLAG